jgi:hypothetical protein
MRYLGRSALGALTAIGLATGSAAAAQQSPAGAPAVAPVGDVTPPADMPAGAGPSGTSRMLASPARFDEVGYAGIASPTGATAGAPADLCCAAAALPVASPIAVSAPSALLPRYRIRQ